MQSLLEYPEVTSGVYKGPDLTKFYGSHTHVMTRYTMVSKVHLA